MNYVRCERLNVVLFDIVRGSLNHKVYQHVHH